jgi:hypothetical protein
MMPYPSLMVMLAMMSEEMNMSIAENQTATSLVELTEAEAARVSGGDNGNHFGQDKNGNDGWHVGQNAKEGGVPAWSINPGKADDAPGHNK